jgi:MazG family protein
MAQSAGTEFERLVSVMRMLRSPEGCAWDRQQTLQSLRPFVLEETYELLETLDRRDPQALREELGDFLYEAVFLAQIAEEEGHFSIADAIQSIVDKLVRRHPHVFAPDGHPLAEARPSLTPTEVVEKWEDLKAKERETTNTVEKTALSGVPRTLPSLLRAYELSSRAAAVGFDWVQAADVLQKIDEEVVELREMVAESPRDPGRVEEEMGDLLFAIVNLARKLGIEPEAALRVANDKFQRRFEGMERSAAQRGQNLRAMSVDALEVAWQEQKRSHEGTMTRRKEATE